MKRDKVLLPAVWLILIAISFLALFLNAFSLIGWIIKGHASFLSLLFFCAAAAVFALAFYIILKTEILMKIKNSHIFALTLFILCFSLKALFTVAAGTKQYSDFQLFYWVTAEIANHTPKYVNQDYFHVWAYQAGYPAVMSVFARLFGTAVRTLVLTNCAFIALSNVVLYLLARLFAQEKTARAAAFAYMLMPFVFGLSTVLTNQHLALLLFYAGIYVFHRYKGSALLAPLAAGFLLAMGNAVRPEGVLMAASFIGLWVLRLVTLRKSGEKDGKKQFKSLLLPYAAVLGSYFLAFALISQAFVLTGLNPWGLRNNFPLYKFAVGLNPDSQGEYSVKDDRMLFENGSSDDFRELKQRAQAVIRERLSSPPRVLLRLFYNKIKVMWTGGGDYPAFTGIPADQPLRVGGIPISAGRLNTLFRFFDYLFRIALFLLILLSAALAFKRKQSGALFTQMALLFLAAFAAYLLIEVQFRYAYIVMPALFILAAPAAEELITRLTIGGRRNAV